MSSNPSWLSDPDPPQSSSTNNGASYYNDNSTPSWLTPPADDVEQPQALTVTVDETEAAPENQQQQQQQQQPPQCKNKETSSIIVGGSATQAASNKTWNEYFLDSFRRDGRLLLITILLIVIMNIPYIQWVLYPFTIFSTWIHELCHGLAAAMTQDGTIYKLEIFPDTSGLATTAVKNDRRGFVVSAGYQGTAVIGCLLLLFRRTKRGPRTGTMVVGCMMILSVCLWIRNIFGIVFILLLGLVMVVCAWILPSVHIRNLYVLLAATCTLNAITSVQNLFGATHSVNGNSVSTDAHTMAELKGGGSTGWALLWLVLALLLTLIGFIFAIPGPDEVADFTCCGICQDLGCFAICNYPGRRLWSHLRGSNTNSHSETSQS